MRAKFIIVGVGLLCLPLGQRVKADIYNDGGVHNIFSGEYAEIRVDDPPPLAGFTTVNWSAETDYMAVSNSGRVTMNGGRIGGTSGMGVDVYDNGQFTMSGGIVGCQIRAHDYSQVTMNGGVLLTSDLVAYDNSQVTLAGGHVEEDLEALSYSHLTWTGGTIEAAVLAHQNSLVTIVGSDFHVYTNFDFDLVFSGHGELDSSFNRCWLSGTLANGESAWAQLFIFDDARISLEPVPLPGAVLLGLLGLGTAGWRLRRRTT